MECKTSKFLNFIDEGLELAKKIPRYFSKFSNRIYCNHQHVVLLVLKQKLATTYRELIEWLNATSEARLLLGLHKVPHHTTLVKFAKKVKHKIVSFFLYHRKADKVAVDATGFELESKSYYFRKIWNSDVKNKTRRFMKLTISANMDSQMIMTYRIRRDYKKCNQEFRSMLKDVKAKYVLADKGYDAKDNRKFVINKLKAIPVIPKKRYTKFYGYLRGRKISGEHYPQRSKVETIFSVIKRRYGSVLKSRSFATQKLEVICKLIAYNIDRKIKLSSLHIIGFQQSPKKRERELFFRRTTKSTS